MKTSPPPDRRKDFPHFLELQTRWHDNDVYGHINNVIYYAYFDSLINRYSQRFTKLILAIAASAALVWAFIDPSNSLLAFTSVLIVASARMAVPTETLAMCGNSVVATVRPLARRVTLFFIN